MRNGNQRYKRLKNKNSIEGLRNKIIRRLIRVPNTTHRGYLLTLLGSGAIESNNKGDIPAFSFFAFGLAKLVV